MDKAEARELMSEKVGYSVLTHSMGAADYKGYSLLILAPSVERQERIKSVLEAAYPGVEVRFETVSMIRRPSVKSAMIPKDKPPVPQKGESLLDAGEAWSEAVNRRICNL